ncbi:ABC transporter [Chitinimonas sp. BJB300]|nr:ABC transporter [Chitinimonas sp. BJB300]TSJ90179.1 amino acid ABC transporter substrate-binding protein [Chitinimonas sp. BJB300]
MLACSGFIKAAADSKVLTFASLDWPPYTGSTLSDQGGSSEVVRAAFKAMGYEVRIKFYPWVRAIKMAEKDANTMAYFPEYSSEEVKQRCALSTSIGRGPLGLAQRKNKPVQWKDIKDLSQWTVGVVQDYVNTAEFDQRVASGKQRVDKSVDDVVNLFKLANSRVDLAIIDPYVFAYLIMHDREVSAVSSQLSINSKLLEEKDLYVCFKKTAEGQRLAAILEQGIRKIDVARIMRNYISNYR